MKPEETKLYTSPATYFSGPDGMRNEVTMWYVACGLLAQESARTQGFRPFGGLGENAKKQVNDARFDLLDVCSGPGNFSIHLSYVQPNIQVTCVDANSKFVDAGKKLRPPWTWVHSDVVQMDLSRKFDIIAASSAYHHIEHERKLSFLKNCKKHLKPDGMMLVCENFLPEYATESERTQSIEVYYSELINYYRKGNATDESIESIHEVYELEKSGIEEMKTSFKVFEDLAMQAGFRIEEDIIVWQSSALKGSNAGSHVLILR